MGSPYRVAQPAPPLVTVFRGKDEARWSIAAWLLLVAPLVPFSGRVGLPPLAAGLLLVLTGVALHAADRRSRRFELRLGPDGYRLRRRRFGVLRTGSFHASLEWEPSFCDEGDDYDPAGFSLVPPRRLLTGRGITPEWPSFGPVRDTPEVRAMLADIQRAVAHFRMVVSAGDVRRESRRRSGDVARLWERADAASVVYGPWGRVRSMKLARGVTFDGLRLPAGTTVEFRFADEWQSPATPDRITGATLGGPARWDALKAPLCKGATLTLDERRRIETVERAFDRPTRVGGVLVDGAACIAFDERGRLTRCSLGAPLDWGPLHLPAGTQVSKILDWGITFHGPGMRIAGAPDARPTRAQGQLTPRGGRATLAEILADPYGRTMPDLHICEHEPGAPSSHRAHRTVKL